MTERSRDIRRKVSDLKKLKTVLEMMAAQCSKGRVPECPIVDAPGRNGPRGRGLWPSKRGRSPRDHQIAIELVLRAKQKKLRAESIGGASAGLTQSDPNDRVHHLVEAR